MNNPPFESPPTLELSYQGQADRTKAMAAFWQDNSRLPWLSSATESALRSTVAGRTLIGRG